jgi:hypothetical protein
MRYRTLCFAIPGLAAAAIGLSACGSQQSAGGSSPGPSDSGVVQPAKPQTDLTVSVKEKASAAAKTWQLTCGPADGDHPDARAACAALDKVKNQGKDPFAAPPQDQMCTQIYGGPQVATVKGTWQGKPVNATFTRKNGCEMKRWTDLAPVLGQVSTGN